MIIYCVLLFYTLTGFLFNLTNADQIIDILEGKRLTLKCSTIDAQRYQWYLNESLLENSTRRYNDGPYLEITRIKQNQDNGQFKCLSYDKNDRIIGSTNIQLNVLWTSRPNIQIITPGAHITNIRTGSNLSLKCYSDNSLPNDSVKYIWLRNYEPLLKSTRIESKKKKLFIKSIKTTDNGVYKCAIYSDVYSFYYMSINSFVLAVEGEKTALINKVPQDSIQVVGTKAQFDCTFHNTKHIEWYFNKTGPLTNNNKYEILSNGTLIIDHVSRINQGIYTCVGIRTDLNDLSQSYAVQLQIAYIKDFDSTNFEPALKKFNNATILLKEYQNFQQTCLSPKSLPNATLSWNYDNNNNNNNVKIREDNQLTIINVTLSNSGNYTCIANNIAGHVEKTIVILVTKTPKIVQHPINQTLNENELLNLKCIFLTTLLDSTKVKWYFNDTILPIKSQTHGNTSTLKIPNVKLKNSGDYYCEIKTENYPPLKSSKAFVQIMEKLKFLMELAIETFAELNTTIKLFCKTNFPVHIYWTRNDSKAFLDNVFVENDSLIIKDIVKENQGFYRCTANNTQNEYLNSTTQLIVVIAPNFLIAPPKLIEATVGDRILMNCIANGNPIPTIRWDKDLNLHDFDSKRIKILANNSLLIEDVQVEDEGVYGCIAGNRAGLNKEQTTLSVNGTSNQPRNKKGSLRGRVVIIDAIWTTSIICIIYLCIVIFLIIFFRKKKIIENSFNTDTDNIDLIHIDNNVKQMKSVYVNDRNNYSYHSDLSEDTNNSKEIQILLTNFEDVILNQNLLGDLTFLSRSEYGNIYNSRIIIDEINKDITERVLVKTLENFQNDKISYELFQHELNMFYKLKHENLVRVIGVCIEKHTLFLVLNYNELVDLKQFMIEKRDEKKTFANNCYRICYQLALGMEYLFQNGIIHKDLALRNCLISTNEICAKIANTKMCKDVYNKEYCKFNDKVIPLRWMPYESVYDEQFTTKSDVYAYGIILWEMYSFGEFPLKKFSDRTVLEKLKNNELHLRVNKLAPQIIKDIQIKAWSVNDSERPSFSNIIQMMNL